MQTEETHEPIPEDGSLEAVAIYPDLETAEAHALVAVAVDAECWLAAASAEGAPGFALLTEAGEAPRLRAEVEAYEAEVRAARSVVALEVPHFPAAPWLTFSWVLALGVVFILQDREPWLTDWGVSSSLGFFDQNEWWRPFTALFLHADLSHLLGNIVFGCLFAPFVARMIGGFLGWSLILLGGFAGNILTAWLHYPERYTALGASTAVFGALGLLTGGGILLAFLTPERAPWARVIVPLGGGVALLGWLGVGDVGTDVLAHAGGFLFGLPFGFAALRARIARPRPA
jgi:rhomboid protease GluP